MKLDGRRAIITGAGRGLGRALGFVLAEAGAELVLTGRDRGKLDHTADGIAARGRRRPDVMQLDLADRGSVEAAIAAVERMARPPDILVNNGAKYLDGTLEENTPDEIVETIASQLTGTILLTRGLLPILKRQPAADVVNIVSVSGLPNVPLQGTSPAFLAAKHGQAGFADGLRQEVIGTNVRATAIHPPNIEDIQPESPGWAANDKRPKLSWITNRDVAEVVLFALTRPRHVTIANLQLDADAGGLYRQ